MKRVFNLNSSLIGRLALGVIITAVCFTTNVSNGYAQAPVEGVAISETGGNPPHPSAILDVQSSERGVLLPSLTDAEMTTLTAIAEDGLLIWNSSAGNFKYFDGVAWQDLGGFGQWSVNATGQIYHEADNVGVGVDYPQAALHIQDRMIVEGELTSPYENGPGTVASWSDKYPTVQFWANVDWTTCNSPYTLQGTPQGFNAYLQLRVDNDCVCSTPAPGYTECEPIFHISEGLISHGDVISLGNFTMSDQSLKENILPLNSTLAKIKQLNTYTYEWKDKKEFGSRKQCGVMAQEVEAVFPELVRTVEGDKLAVNYGGLVTPLLKATQEQQEIIEDLQSELQTLRSDLDQLKREVEAMRNE